MIDYKYYIVEVQAEIPNGNSYRRSSGSLHRVVDYSAGGPGVRFSTETQQSRKLYEEEGCRCSSGQASATYYYLIGEM